MPKQKGTPKTAPVEAPPAPRSRPLPEWLINMPRPSNYQLAMVDSDGNYVNEIMLMRDEWKSLKVHLARLRGFETPEWHELLDDYFDLEPDPADHPMCGSQKLGATGNVSFQQTGVK